MNYGPSHEYYIRDRSEIKLRFKNFYYLPFHVALDTTLSEVYLKVFSSMKQRIGPLSSTPVQNQFAGA